MTVEEMLRSGDRAAFKQYLAAAPSGDVALAWIKARAANVQDFGNLALAELQKRAGENPRLRSRHTKQVKEE
jgi:hypothetical protein